MLSSSKGRTSESRLRGRETTQLFRLLCVFVRASKRRERERERFGEREREERYGTGKRRRSPPVSLIYEHRLQKACVSRNFPSCRRRTACKEVEDGRDAPSFRGTFQLPIWILAASMSQHHFGDFLRESVAIFNLSSFLFRYVCVMASLACC